MTRLCFVSPSYYLNTVGGAEVQLHMMATGLAGLGCFDVSYVTTDARESGYRDGVRVVPIPGSVNGRRCSFADFAQAVDSVSPDLVMQLGRKQFTTYAARYCALRNVPFMFSAASDIDCRRFRELPRYFGEFPLGRWRHPMRVVRALTMDRKTFSAMKSANLVVAQTATQQRKLMAILGRKVPVFQNLHHVPSENTIVKDQPPMVLWLASIKPVKRPGLFLEISKSLRGRGFRVVMAGRMNDESFRDEIERRVSAGDLEYIEDVGFEESNELIARASVFVITSRHEGLPNTLIQAWLRRTPTVSLGVDPDDMIEENGIGTRTNTVSECVDEIASLLVDRDRRERMGSAARAFATDRFGIDSQAKRLKELIDATLARH